MSLSSEYAVGQRWLATSEPELGLGMLMETDIRSVTLFFPANGEQRIYAKQSDSLKRILFAAQDTITSHEGWELKIQEVELQNGICLYHGIRVDTQDVISLPETQLNHHFRLDDPIERLQQSQFDSPKWFALRHQCISHRFNHLTSPLLGMLGARVSLIPHQLNIANQVGQRVAPRVLLADEVGLGKTIEAALIIHQQILTGRAQRVLIVLPPSLVHQWLVEMLRKVNLAFAIFDQTRCESLVDEGGNPFDTEQLVICSLDFLTTHEKYYQQALQSKWDLLVVDEAHHLAWSVDEVSQEYTVVEGLANVSPGVLLLTATPEQLGHESHFARLRLLDPNRFHDYQTFVEEESHYSDLADAIAPLFDTEALSDEQTQTLNNFLPIEEDLSDQNEKQHYIHRLIDQHGTGRLLFRNSRNNISGFPTRQLFTYPLKQPILYEKLLQKPRDISEHLHPEQIKGAKQLWLEQDPRLPWFAEHITSLKGEKILTICSSANTAMQIADWLKTKHGTRCTLFHEGMSILERDKAADYFAQDEDGAQVLICSEIGSEGRNFQFANHLVLFDLPLVPDLLEQRIGRLDRIGQTKNVCIHLPYFEQTAQDRLLHWYHNGLNAFEHTCPTGTTVYQQVSQPLLECLITPDAENAYADVMKTTIQLHTSLKAQLEQGRDKLLELNSSGQGKIENLISQINDSDDSPALERFMSTLFDTIGVLQEEKDSQCYFLKPTEAMHTLLPGLDDEGMTITYERQVATQLEHVRFLSWDHPLVHHAIDTVLTDVQGKSAIGLCNNKQLPQGAYWVEYVYIVSASAEKHLQLERYLPPTPLHFCLDSQNSLVDLSWPMLSPVSEQVGNQLCQALGKPIAINQQLAQKQAETLANQLKQNTTLAMQKSLDDEIQRLQDLQKRNPAIRQEEIDHLVTQKQQLTVLIENAELHLEAVRLVLNHSG
jgi:ATP-dependent helicase HepA